MNMSNYEVSALYRMIKELIKDSKGSVTVLIAISAVAIIGFTSLVLDMGQLFLTKERLGNALDAAVLAGAQELPDDPGSAVAKVQEYFTSHGMDLSALTSTEVSADNKTISATAQTTVQYALAKVLGINSADAHCSAAARIEPITAVKGVVPVGIKKQELVFDQEYQLKIASSNDLSEYLGPGNFGVLALSGFGSSSYEDDFKHGYDGTVKIGDVLETASGNKSGATRDGVNYRVGQCTHACTPEHFDPSCPRLVVIPVYVPEDVQNGKVNSVRIVGFAAFLLSVPGGKLVGNESYVSGRYVQMTLFGDSDPGQDDYGAYSVRLVE